MSTLDDLPWPELGNVSRGATRGNQGQKGVLGPPDRDGRCILQLRVQPGVLAVKLNSQASEWYRILDNEVNRALKMTKTYWRKARRRQDYDARADQDHMELHEWLQQLKDKTMSHLELLMQKGEIQGPPYVMPDDMELSFLRRFVERQAAGIPHNPRLRNGVAGEASYLTRHPSDEAFTPDATSQDFLDRSTNEDPLQRSSASPAFRNPGGLVAEATSSKQALAAARTALFRAQKDTEDAFMRYTSCLDLERQARLAVLSAEKRRDDIMAVLLSQSQQLNLLPDTRSRKSSVSGDDRHSPHRYPIDARNPVDPFMNARVQDKPVEWPTDGSNLYSAEAVHHMDDSLRGRKRQWEHDTQLHSNGYPCDVAVGAPSYESYRPDRPYDSSDIQGLPPRKRMHHPMIPGFDVLNGATLQNQSMSLQS